jgi:hypothetical protein
MFLTRRGLILFKFSRRTQVRGSPVWLCSTTGTQLHPTETANKGRFRWSNGANAYKGTAAPVLQHVDEVTPYTSQCITPGGTRWLENAI